MDAALSATAGERVAHVDPKLAGSVHHVDVRTVLTRLGAKVCAPDARTPRRISASPLSREPIEVVSIPHLGVAPM
jgi:hypothetical protein